MGQKFEIAKLKPELADRFAKLHFQNAIFRCAVKEAKNLGFQDDEIGNILLDQLKYGQEIGKLKQMIYDELFAYNIAHLKDCWYTFYWVTAKGNKRLAVEPLLPAGVEVLRRDIKVQQPLTHKEYMELRPQVIDFKTLKSWDQNMCVERDKLLHEYLNVAAAIGESDGAMIVTAHAFKRWKERVLASNEAYNKSDLDERDRLYRQIVAAFQQASKAYQIADGEFFLSQDRMICFVIKRNVIVTLYIHDFGFTPEINRMIALRQLKYIKHLTSEIKKAKPKQQTLIAEIDDKINIKDEQIRQVQSELEALLAEKQKLDAEKAALEDKIRQDQASLTLEGNKLFKKWVPVDTSNSEQDEDD